MLHRRSSCVLNLLKTEILKKQLDLLNLFPTTTEVQALRLEKKGDGAQAARLREQVKKILVI